MMGKTWEVNWIKTEGRIIGAPPSQSVTRPRFSAWYNSLRLAGSLVSVEEKT